MDGIVRVWTQAFSLKDSGCRSDCISPRTLLHHTPNPRPRCFLCDNRYNGKYNCNQWMASLTWWTWVWASSGSWWWTGRPGVLQSMGLQRVGHDWVTELNWTDSCNQEIGHYLFLQPNSNLEKEAQGKLNYILTVVDITYSFLPCSFFHSFHLSFQKIDLEQDGNFTNMGSRGIVAHSEHKVSFGICSLTN